MKTVRIKTNVKAAGDDGISSNPTPCRCLPAINHKARALGLSLLFVFALALLMAKPTSAQIDPNVYEIFQNGIKTGEIFVPDRDLSAINYVEHWVLFDSYVYPGKDPSLVTTIKMARKRSYESETDFFARVPWGPGFRYVRVDSTDTDRLPGR
jgi:hypothetical protein